MHKPNMGREELQALIMKFRVYLREKRGLVSQLVEFLFHLTELFFRHPLARFGTEPCDRIDQFIHRGLRLGRRFRHNEISIVHLPPANRQRL